MSLIATFRRLENLDFYISSRKTGTRAQLAAKLNVSVSTLQDHINFMKLILGAPIEFDHNLKTYYYTSEGKIDLKFRAKSDKFLQEAFYEHVQAFLKEKDIRFND